jgi:hypothetical protein
MALTLIVGAAQQAFETHPTEIARRALMAAAEVESPRLADQLLRFAEALPDRGPIVKERV